jgi:hypothetical protein
MMEPLLVPVCETVRVLSALKPRREDLGFMPAMDSVETKLTVLDWWSD